MLLAMRPRSQVRVNLTRSKLMLDAVDAMPTLQGVDPYAECLLAAFDQNSYSRTREKGAVQQPLKRRHLGDLKAVRAPEKVSRCMP